MDFSISKMLSLVISGIGTFSLPFTVTYMRSSSGILSTSIDFNLLHHSGNGMPPEAIDTTNTRHLKGQLQGQAAHKERGK